MRLTAEQLDAHLSGRLASIYLVSGDEPLLVQDACAAVRAAARRSGCNERLVFEADGGFDWNLLTQSVCDLSLFADRRLLEVRLASARPGDVGAKALTAYAERPVEGDVLLVQMPRLDASARRAKWLGALDAAGVVVQVWPPDAAQLPAWVLQRMRARGLQPSRETAAALAERAEGNLLACAQEIEKLLLLNGPGAVSLDAVLDTVADQARFDVFALVDGALAGDVARCTRILERLRGEGVEPVLVLWALAREIRTLAAMAAALEQGTRLEALFQRHQVWPKRQDPVRAALKRHNTRRWWRLTRRAARIDRVIKGAAAGNAWDELLQLTTLIAGLRIVEVG